MSFTVTLWENTDKVLGKFGEYDQALHCVMAEVKRRNVKLDEEDIVHYNGGFADNKSIITAITLPKKEHILCGIVITKH